MSKFKAGDQVKFIKEIAGCEVNVPGTIIAATDDEIVVSATRFGTVDPIQLAFNGDNIDVFSQATNVPDFVAEFVEVVT